MINTFKYQTTGKRILASIVDGIVFMPISLLCANFAQSQYEALRITGCLFETVCWGFYIVIGHGKYGQTLGKKLMQIKVLDISEKSCIGYKRAFIRESIWFASIIVSFIYYYFFSGGYSNTDNLSFDDYVSFFSLFWLLLEIVTMLFNEKRRAIHDFMAGSVVVSIPELEREKRMEARDEWVYTLKSD